MRPLLLLLLASAAAGQFSFFNFTGDFYNTDFLLNRLRRRHPRDEGRVRLVGGRNSKEGNVEIYHSDRFDILFGWRSVCDIGWGSEEAAVVCRQLGFSGPATATRNGRFGFRSAGYWLSNVRCSGRERRLGDCRHDGWGRASDCRSTDLAGVICGADDPTPDNSPVRIRLINGNQRQGDVEVRYGSHGWGPVCGDGFGLKEAQVVCRQLGQGAAVRGYISGRVSGRRFLMSGTNCRGRETNLGQCASERVGRVFCPGGRASGAAVQCAGSGQTSPGTPLPDLTIDARTVASSATLDTTRLGDLTCALDENCLAQSAYDLRRRDRNWRSRFRKLLRFTNKVSNLGRADYRPQKDPSLWEWHACHEHFHSEESFSEYDLVRPGTTTKQAEGHKASFCLEDSECTGSRLPRYQCGAGASATRAPQGISAGCADIYGSYIDCQWIDVTDVPVGRYQLRVRVNADRKVPEVTYNNNQVICDVNLQRSSVRVTNCKVGALPR